MARSDIEDQAYVHVARVHVPLVRGPVRNTYHGGMYGLNIISRATPDDQEKLEVCDVFHTIQGEGPFAGVPAVFVRLAGCNLQCKFCDTDFDPIKHRVTGAECAEMIRREARRVGSCGLVVLTGGEPMRQEIGPLIRAVNEKNMQVQVETSGTLWRSPWMNDLFEARNYDGHVPTTGNVIVCSPKTTRIAPGIHPYIHALKYVCQSKQMCVRDGMPVANTQRKGPAEQRPLRPQQLKGPVLHPSQVYVQPCSTSNKLHDAQNLIAATQICLRFGYRLSLRVNKLVKLPN